MLTLNPLATTIKPSATLAINQQTQRMQEQGDTVYHWGFGQSAFPVPTLIVEALKQNAHQKSYLPGLGLPALREAVAQYNCQEFKLSTDADQVVIGPGSKELIYNLLYLVEGELLLPAPSWVSYEPQARLLNKPFRWLPTAAENNHTLNAETLEQAIQQSQHKQHILLLNSPNNPTGCMYQGQALRNLAQVCKRHNIIVISDEIYANVNFDRQAKHHSMAHYYPEGTFVTAGLSKLFAAGGYRLGTCIVPKALQKTILPAWHALISETFSCVSSPIQYAAQIAYQHFDLLRDTLQDYAAIQAIASRTIYQCLCELGIDCVEPEGAFYLMPDFEPLRDLLLQQGITTSEQLSSWLLNTVHIATLPATDFGLASDKLCLRIAAVDFDGSNALKHYHKQKELGPQQFSLLAMPAIHQACKQLKAIFASIPVS